MSAAERKPFAIETWAAEVAAASRRMVEEHQPPRMVTYPFPLRPTFLARIVLPEDLSKAEAARLAAMVESMPCRGDER